MTTESLKNYLRQKRYAILLVFVYLAATVGVVTACDHRLINNSMMMGLLHGLNMLTLITLALLPSAQPAKA